VNERDIRIRNYLYGRFVENGRPLGVAKVSEELALNTEEVEAAFRRLDDAHALVLESNTLEIRMLNPFSCVPSAWRVHAAGRTWYSNCAWDSFGICAALQTDGRIEASCADCGERIELEVRDRQAVSDDYLFHVLVPARHWWDDIVFT
jgi:hypothetical protein